MTTLTEPPPATVPVQRTKRILLYSHDSYGLGHLRRTLLIAGRLAALDNVSDVVVATGSPRAQSFDVPAGVDTVKLPAITKDESGCYVGRSLRMPFAELVEFRADLLSSVARSLRPDVVVVDHTPTGLAGELLPTLRAVRPRARLVLGLRDIIDDPAFVAAQWRDERLLPLVQEYYDHVLVYGDPTIVTTASELGLEHSLPGRVTHVGYLSRPMPQPRPTGASDRPSVLVTAGGGGDGHHLLRAWAEFLNTLGPAAPFTSVVLTGPLMAARRRTEITRAIERSGAPATVMAFSDAPEAIMAAASAVISMAGYNSVCELLALGVPALLVPRERPRREQLLRAQRLAETGCIEMAQLDTLTPAALGSFVTRAVARGRHPAPLELGGVDGVARVVAGMLTDTGCVPCAARRP